MDNKKVFFASSNSYKGFQSYFDLIYNPKDLKKIYIVKGGPGTGKSHLMKSVAEHFEGENYVEYFLCSSDVNSIDGIIINKKIAVVDGTSPHVVEAKYPGAVEVLVDNGKGINSEIAQKTAEILKLNDNKSELYKCAYAFLKNAGELKTEYMKMISCDYYLAKLDSAANRFFKQNIEKGKGYSEEVRLIEGITPVGVYKTKSFELLSNKKCIIINAEGFDNLIYDSFLARAKEYGIKTSLSFDPLLPNKINGLYFPESKISVTSYSEKLHGEVDYEKYKVINGERFINKENFIKNRAKLRFTAKAQALITEEAIKYLKEASIVHMKLEKLYKDNMNYSCVNGYLSEIVDEINFLLTSL